jgi:hypothetical protein
MLRPRMAVMDVRAHVLDNWVRMGGLVLKLNAQMAIEDVCLELFGLARTLSHLCCA